MSSQQLLLVGCGKMGAALLGGWRARGVAAGDVTVVEPFSGAAIKSEFGVNVVEAAADLPDGYTPDIVIFAVKPQVMDDVIPPYKNFVRPETVFLSIAAGRTIASFERLLGEAAVVRAMPNTPAAVGRGITVACGNAPVTADQKAACLSLLDAVGVSAWAEEESTLDPVTAVSGSGPAYVFLLIECMAEAGVAAGLDRALADQLALETVAGAGELAKQAADDPATLRENVTSPGGTTEAALQVLRRDGAMQALMTEAIMAATKRSRDLAG